MTGPAPIAGALALISASSAPALERGPFAADIPFAIENDAVADSSDTAIEVSPIYATIEAAITKASGASEFLFVHAFGAGEIIPGRFNPAFGAAWDEAPGILGADFAEDYQLHELICASENVASVALFNAGRSVQSQSPVRKRGKAGGLGNTSAADTVTIDMRGALGVKAYSACVQNLARGMGVTHDQRGAVADVTHTYGLVRPVALLAEMAHFTDFGGTSNAARSGPVTLSGVYSSHKRDGASPVYRHGREGANKTHTIDTVIACEFQASLRQGEVS